MRKNLRAFPLLLMALAGFSGSAVAQTTNTASSASSTNAASATPPAGVPLANVVSTAVEDANKLQEIQTGITGDQTVADVQRTVADSAKNVDRRKPETDKLLDSAPTLPLLRSTQEIWQMLADDLSTPKQLLSSRISKLDSTETQLGEMNKKWQATLVSAKSAAAPTDLLNRINAILLSIGQVTKAGATLRGQILSTQSELVGQESRIAAELALIGKAQASAVNLLFVRDSAPIWGFASQAVPQPPMAAPAPVAVPPSHPMASETTELRAYVADKFPTALLHLLIFNGLAVVLFFVRREMTVRTRDDPALQRAAAVFQVPIAMAAILALLLSGWFYPLAPRLFMAGIGAAALIPAVIILRRLIEPSLFPILYAMVAAYLVDQLRYGISAQILASRILFLFELLGIVFFLLWLVRSQRLSQTAQDLLQKVVRIYAYCALPFLLMAALANILGYTNLSTWLGSPILVASRLAIILYAAVRVADGIILATLKIRPFSLLGMVQRHFMQMAGNASAVVRWAASLFWIWIVLELFSLRTPILQRIWFALNYSVPYGSLKLALWPLLLFGLTIWAAVLVSRFIRFVLAEEVFPHLRLAAGVPYATSTMVHYTVLVLGTLFALNALGIDLGKYAVLAGALGVGLGFGLQNIINNFVSGIILLFERPIKVGDVLQLDATTMGTVERIGIRASVIRVTNGSEIIMPNGNLISNQVINWTLSDRRRSIDIPVTVAAKSDPQKVIALLSDTAKGHPLVLKDPAPQVLFTNITGGALNFELRAWTNSYESWGQIRSELFLAISAALAREEIAMV